MKTSIAILEVEQVTIISGSSYYKRQVHQSDRGIKKSAIVEENFLRSLHSEFTVCYRERAKGETFALQALKWAHLLLTRM